MKRGIVLLFVLCVSAAPSFGQDIELEFSEETLNGLMQRLGDPSDGGVHYPTPAADTGLFHDCVHYGVLECLRAATVAPPDVEVGPRVPLARCRWPDGRVLVVPGDEPVAWQWWITGARFNVENERLELSATVRSRVGARWSVETRTVPATLQLDPATQRLRVKPAAFKVPVKYELAGATELITHVDVAKFLTFAVPIAGQRLTVPRLDGTQRTLTSSVQSASVQYLAGKIKVRANVRFN